MPGGTLTIIPTYKCTAACKDCCFGSNPSITKRIPQDKVLNYIDEAAAVGSIQQICFSGGEPFLLKSDLEEAIERCAHHGFLTRIVSNGYWATSINAAETKLKRLVAMGLNEINFSTGKDHLEWVKIDFILNGMEAALSLGLTIALMIELRADSNICKTEIIKVAREQNREKLANSLEANMIHVVESPWMSFTEDETVPAAESSLINRFNVANASPCQSIFRTLVIPPSENLGICCGLPREEIEDLNLGDLNDNSIPELFNNSISDLLKIWLFAEGPEKMLSYAAKTDSSIEWENMYAHQCDVCRRVMTDEQVITAISKIDEHKMKELITKFSTFIASNSNTLPQLCNG